MSKLQGLNHGRTQREATEKAFVEVWRKINEEASGPINDFPHRLLEHILSPNQPQMEVISDRDVVVAETVIQWLGSNVGQNFLKEVVNKSPELQKVLKNS